MADPRMKVIQFLFHRMENKITTLYSRTDEVFHSEIEDLEVYVAYLREFLEVLP
jgi:hypothetical protein